MKLNDIIFQTLKTKSDKPAKHAELLESMGYILDNEGKYWSVNGLRFYKLGGKLEANLRPLCYVAGVDQLKKIDWANFFAVHDEREAKREALNAVPTGIYQDKNRHVWYNANECVEGNAIVEEYKRLKQQADQGNTSYDMLKHARADVLEAKVALEKAQEKYIKAQNKLVDAQQRCEYGQVELNAFLVKRNIRKAR